MKNYEQIDISGDVGLRVFGETDEKLFQNAAAGMYELITDVSTVTETEEKEIALSAENHEVLLVRWLNELVFLYDTYGFTGRRSTVHIKNAGSARDDENSQLPLELKAVVSGGIFDPDINEQRLLIKAATYHTLTVRKTSSRWEATVIFDI